MILIKNIEIVEVPRSQWEIIDQCKAERVDLRIPISKNKSFTMEMVYGRRYHTADGREIIIGMSERVQKTIGLTYEAFDGLRATSDKILSELLYVNKQLRRIKDMNFWNRLKTLFYGYKKYDIYNCWKSPTG